MLLADAAPPGTEQFIAIAMYLIVSITAVVALWRMLKKSEPMETEIGGQPIKVKFATQFATKEELGALQERVQHVEQRIDVQFERLREERRSSVAQLHKRIEETTGGVNERVTELLAAFSKLQGTCEAHLKNPKLFSHHDRA